MTGFRREGTSPRRYGKFSFTIRRKCSCRQNVISFKIRKVIEQVFDRHARCEVFQHIVNRDPQAANARISCAFIGINANARSVVDHAGAIRRSKPWSPSQRDCQRQSGLLASTPRETRPMGARKVSYLRIDGDDKIEFADNRGGIGKIRNLCVDWDELHAVLRLLGSHRALLKCGPGNVGNRFQDSEFHECCKTADPKVCRGYRHIRPAPG